MKKEKKKREWNWSKIIFCNRHFLAFITTIMFLFFYGMNAWADTFTGTDLSNNLNEWYRMNSTYYGLDKQAVLDHAFADGYDTSEITTTWSAFPASQTNFSGYFDNTLAYSFVVLDGITNSTAGIDYEFSGCQYHAYMVFSSDFTNSISMTMLGTGNFAYVFWNNHNWVVSDAPFAVGIKQKYPSGSTYNVINVTTASANGLYLLTNYDGFRTVFVDMPVYVPSTDGSSGFTTFNVNTTDFSFSNENYDFNYILKEELVKNPNAPSNIPTVVNPNSKYYMNAGLNTYFYGNSLHNFSIGYNWTGNNYLDLHPEQFNVHTDLRVTFAYGNRSQEIFSSSLDYPYSYIRNGKYEHSLDLLTFKNTDSQGNPGIPNYTLYEAYSRALGTITEASQSYVDTLIDASFSVGPVSIGGSYEQELILKEDFVKSEGIPDGVYDFVIYADTYIVATDIDRTHSGTFSNHYNFLDGQLTTDLNNITQNYYPPSSSGDPSLPDSTINPVSNTSGNTNTATGGSVVNAFDHLAQAAAEAVGGAGGAGGSAYVTVNGSGGTYNGFVLTPEDSNKYANILQKTTDLMNDTTENNSFLEAVARVYGMLPQEVWNFMMLGVGTVATIQIYRVARPRT
ncbi:MAG: hypothetical protein IJM25_11770 [Eubacterium sp.]|nr:hypothetical protein [Eubacterium sp.]